MEEGKPRDEQERGGRSDEQECVSKVKEAGLCRAREATVPGVGC